MRIRRGLVDRMTLEERLRAYVIISPSGCWEWQGSFNDAGYGRMRWRGRIYRAHRLAAHLWLGMELNSSSVVCHRCDNRPCINPEHLWLGTQGENNSDMFAKGRARPYKPPRATHCQRSHAITGTNLAMRNGKPRCRTCWNAMARDRRARARLALTGADS